MMYELWDSESGNCIGAYASEAEALSEVALLADQYGPQSREVRTLGLLTEDGEGGGELIARGPSLIHRARAASPAALAQSA